MLIAVVAFVPDAVHAPEPAVVNSVIVPPVSSTALPKTLVPLLSDPLNTNDLDALGRIVVGPPVSVNVVAFDVPVITGISSVTRLPTRTNDTVPVGDVVMPVAVAV